MPGTAVIIVAAGRGRRFGAPVAKQYLTLRGAPLVRHAVAAFVNHPGIDTVQPVIDLADAEMFAAAVAGLNVAAPVAGGASRQESVLAGLRALAASAPSRVLIHDAARPLVSAALIDRVLAALDTAPGAIPALPVVDTLKRVDAAMTITATQPRDGLYRAQTPQGFDYPSILQAHERAAGQSLTDDAAVMEAAGHSVAIVAGDDDNLKVTTAEDLSRLERMTMAGPNSDPSALPDVRVGNGFDVHRLGPGDGVMLCGVKIPAKRALIGHSDADVALHAVTDAVLGAIAAGDIGSHFPPTDDTWRGASSDRFLAHACALMRDAGYGIGNIDVTIICESPKIGPHRAAMQSKLAEIAGVESSRVSVKATTTERLGFTGRGEGIAVQASVVLQRGG